MDERGTDVATGLACCSADPAQGQGHAPCRSRSGEQRLCLALATVGRHAACTVAQLQAWDEQRRCDLHHPQPRPPLPDGTCVRFSMGRHLTGGLRPVWDWQPVALRLEDGRCLGKAGVHGVPGIKADGSGEALGGAPEQVARGGGGILREGEHQLRYAVVELHLRRATSALQPACNATRAGPGRCSIRGPQHIHEPCTGLSGWAS